MLLACSGIFDDDGPVPPAVDVNVTARLENNDEQLPVHMWIGAGQMTDENRVDPGQFRNQTQGTRFEYPQTTSFITVSAQRPDTTVATASVPISLAQAQAGYRVVGRWTSEGGVTAEVVAPNPPE
jgi:hypothetical protein